MWITEARMWLQTEEVMQELQEQRKREGAAERRPSQKPRPSVHLLDPHSFPSHWFSPSYSKKQEPWRRPAQYDHVQSKHCGSGRREPGHQMFHADRLIGRIINRTTEKSIALQSRRTGSARALDSMLHQWHGSSVSQLLLQPNIRTHYIQILYFWTIFHCILWKKVSLKSALCRNCCHFQSELFQFWILFILCIKKKKWTWHYLLDSI